MSEEYVDQDSMVEDFFDGHELVSQDTGEPAIIEGSEIEQNAEPAKTEPQAQTTEPVTENVETETAENTDVDPFSFMDQGEDGAESFNAISAMEFLERKNADKQESFTAQAPEVATQEQVQAEAQEVQNEVPVEDNIRTNLFSGLDYVKQYLDAGYDHASAIALAEQSLNRDYEAYTSDKRMSDMEARIMEQVQGKKQEISYAEEMAQLRPKSTQNLHEVAKASGYKSVNELSQALMKPEYGGDVINYLYGRDNPNAKFNSVEERAQSMQDWFTRFTADKQAVQFLEVVARARIQDKLMPEIVKMARSAKVGVDQSNAQGKGMRNTAVSEVARNNPANQAPNALDAYMNSIDVV